MKRRYVALLFIFVFFASLNLNCKKDEGSLNEKQLIGKLIGEWIETSPCDSCLSIAFNADDTIFLYNNLDNTILTLTYQVISKDSIEVVRNWEIELDRKKTKHRAIFFTNDTLEITQFLAVDHGITGFDDIKLFRE